MCGKFTAKASWNEIVDLVYREPRPAERDKSVQWTDLSGERAELGRGASRSETGGNDRTLTYRVMGAVPLIVFDHVAGRRRVVPMRWGFPHPQDWKRPQPIHARSETIDTTRAFADAFRDGQRGIALVETFNEAPDNGAQHVVTPPGAIGIAFVWRRFEIAAAPAPLFACVMVTAPANKLLSGLPTDRMPAILSADDWAIWLGEEPAGLEEVKACLKTVEDARWTMTPDERAKSAQRRKPTISDPAGLF